MFSLIQLKLKVVGKLDPPGSYVHLAFRCKMQISKNPFVPTHTPCCVLYIWGMFSFEYWDHLRHTSAIWWSTEMQNVFDGKTDQCNVIMICGRSKMLAAWRRVSRSRVQHRSALGVVYTGSPSPIRLGVVQLPVRWQLLFVLVAGYASYWFCFLLVVLLVGCATCWLCSCFLGRLDPIPCCASFGLLCKLVVQKNKKLWLWQTIS